MVMKAKGTDAGPAVTAVGKELENAMRGIYLSPAGSARKPAQW